MTKQAQQFQNVPMEGEPFTMGGVQVGQGMRIENTAEVLQGMHVDRHGLPMLERWVGKTPPPNPKQIYGDKKPPLGYIPLSAQLSELQAFFDGMLKYGPHNWRKNPVEAMTYVEAAIRHLQLWKCGEELTRDTLVENLGAVRACCGILIDAVLHGTLIDNRPKSKEEADLLYAGEEWVSRLKAVDSERKMKIAS